MKANPPRTLQQNAGPNFLKQAVISAVVAVVCVQSAVVDAGEISERFATGPSARLDLSNISGEIQITGWDAPEIELTGRLDPNAELELGHEGRRVDVKVVKKKSGRKMRGSTLVVRVPFESELSVYAVSSDLEVEGVDGPQRLEVVSGNIRVSHFIRDLQVKSVSGDVLLQGKGQPARVSVVSVSGNTTVRNAAGELDIKSVSGATRVAEGAFDRVEVTSTSGRVEFRGDLSSNGKFDADVMSGNVSIELDDSSSLDVEIETFSGNIETCLGEDPVRKGKHMPGQVLQFSRGAANRDVRVRSMSGSVELCDR